MKTLENSIKTMWSPQKETYIMPVIKNMAVLVNEDGSTCVTVEYSKPLPEIKKTFGKDKPEPDKSHIVRMKLGKRVMTQRELNQKKVHGGSWSDTDEEFKQIFEEKQEVSLSDDSIDAIIKKLKTENPSKKQLGWLIANVLNRFTGSKGDERSILMLIAAMNMLNLSDGSDQIMSAARRLITVALVQPRKK
jgi:hypothetical protein